MKSIDDIDLSPKSGKKYWKSCHREWREEFIYFLLVDRFHDNNKRHSADFEVRHPGFGDDVQLGKQCGGTLRVWLSPVFKNNPESYHGYGDNWPYLDGYDYYYYNGLEFPFGNWRYEDKPIPIELRNPALYSRKGQIRNFDDYPETKEGDFFNLRAFKNDESREAIYAQKILTAIHCYWSGVFYYKQ